MDSLYFHIGVGLGLLLIGIGVADGTRIFLKPYMRLLLQTYNLAKRGASRPILLEKWNLPRT